MGQVQGTGTNNPFHAGFSAAMLRQFNENDARAAIKVWVDALVKEGTFQADSTAKVYDNAAALVTALQSNEVDGVTLTVTDLFEIKDKVKFDRFIFDVNDGSYLDEYVILVHQDSDITRIEDLQDRTLNVLLHPRMCLAVPWLDTLLMERGLKPSQTSCSQVTEKTKLTQAILPVFFRQTDACLVTRKGFKTMSELNPQVGRRLRVLASSPEMVTTGFFLRAGFSKADQDKFVDKIVRIHATLAGQQVLTVFQTERLEERPTSILDKTFALLEHHRQLLAGTNNLKTAGIETTLPRRDDNGEAR
jgi:phosphonate transport system substrate-binding protein